VNTLILILLVTFSHARLPTHEEKQLWDVSVERTACIDTCKLKAVQQICSPNIPCDCSAKCFETDGSKFIEKLYSQEAAQKQAMTTAKDASEESATVGLETVAVGIVEDDSQKITTGIEALEAAAELKNQENKIRESIRLDLSPLTAKLNPDTFEKLETVHKIDRMEFKRRMLSESPRLVLKEMLGIESPDNPKDAGRAAAAVKGDEFAYREERRPARSVRKGLREALKEKLLEGEESGASSAVAVVKIEGLKPLENFSVETSTSELNLFDVVKRKYQELKQRGAYGL
jgi:hypothetical protein